MPLSKRYSPEFAPGESSIVGLDFSFVVPPGVGLEFGSLSIWTNVANPVESSDFTIGEVTVRGRTLYAQLTGGKSGVDYQLRWVAVDSEQNIWPRVALLLCSLTS